MGVTPICKVHDLEGVSTRLACIAFAHGPGLSTVANCVHELISAKMMPHAHVCQSAINTQPHPCFLTMKFRHVYLRFESSHETRSLLSFRSWKPAKGHPRVPTHLAPGRLSGPVCTAHLPASFWQIHAEATWDGSLFGLGIKRGDAQVQTHWPVNVTSPGSVRLGSAFSRRFPFQSCYDYHTTRWHHSPHTKRALVPDGRVCWNQTGPRGLWDKSQLDSLNSTTFDTQWIRASVVCTNND